MPATPEEKAIEMAKKFVMSSDPLVTWEDIMNNINNRIRNGELDNYKFTGWEAIEVSESEYSVICKNEVDGEMGGEVFHVGLDDDTVRYIDFGKDMDNKITILAKYVMLTLNSSTFSPETASERARDVLSALMKQEYVKLLEGMGVLKGLQAGE